MESFQFLSFASSNQIQPGGFDINKLYQEAKDRWLKPSEVLFILKNHQRCRLTYRSLKQPPSGSLFLLNRGAMRYFREDGHMWRKRKDGRTAAEGHAWLKVENVNALHCYYVRGEQNPHFQRRIYCMVDRAYDHIVLVHYRELAEEANISGANSNTAQGENISDANSNTAAQGGNISGAISNTGLESSPLDQSTSDA